MNNTTSIAEVSPIKRFSAGEILRREFENPLGAPLSFGDTLMMLHEHNLPLPRYGRSFNPKGIKLLREALRRQKHG